MMSDHQLDLAMKWLPLESMGGKDAVLEWLFRGQAQLFTDQNCAMATMVKDGHRLWVFGAGGSVPELAVLFEDVQKWAAEWPCDSVCAPPQFRPGFGEMLQGLGYQHHPDTGEYVKKIERRMH